MISDGTAMISTGTDTGPVAPPRPAAELGNRRLKIAYAYEFDAADISVQSGRPHNILRQLERTGQEVVRAFPLNRRLSYLFAPKYMLQYARNRVYRPDREPLLLRHLAAQLRHRLARSGADCVFAPGSHMMAYLEDERPSVFCADATFANVLNFYDSFERCSASFVAQGHDLDRRALRNCAAAIYPSTWAARSAIHDYGADPEKVHVVPFGANVDAPERAVVQASIRARTFGEVRLLFIGRDWYRKGGDIVVEACELLRRRRVPVRLDIIGIEHLPSPVPSYAHLEGLLDKRNQEHRRRLETLLRSAHFLFVPSRAENYGMVYCEAAAFGVPSIASACGGVPTIVRDGETGLLVAGEGAPVDYADAIESCLDDPVRYGRLAHCARRDFETRLNWETFGRRIVELLETVSQ